MVLLRLSIILYMVTHCFPLQCIMQDNQECSKKNKVTQLDIFTMTTITEIFVAGGPFFCMPPIDWQCSWLYLAIIVMKEWYYGFLFTNEEKEWHRTPSPNNKRPISMIIKFSKWVGPIRQKRSNTNRTTGAVA